MHSKYRSHTNHYEIIKEYMPLGMPVMVSEKLDGSNFSLIAHNGALSYASRNQIVDPMWNGLHNLVPAEIRIKFMEFAKQYTTVHLYGEVFSSKILRRIPYGEPKVRFFDLMLDGKYVSGSDFIKCMTRMGIADLAVISIITTLDTALSMDVETIYSAHAPSSIAEGIIIRPLQQAQFTDRIGCIKYKSKNFAEKSNTKVRTTKSLSEQQVEFMAYVNENRMLSYISKVGEPKSMADMGPYIKGILDDAYNEYISTLSPDAVMVAHDRKDLMSVGSKLIVPLLKTRIQNALHK